MTGMGSQPCRGRGQDTLNPRQLEHGVKVEVVTCGTNWRMTKVVGIEHKEVWDAVELASWDRMKSKYSAERFQILATEAYEKTFDEKCDVYLDATYIWYGCQLQRI